MRHNTILTCYGRNKQRMSARVPLPEKSAQIQQRREIGGATEGGMPEAVEKTRLDLLRNCGE